MRILALETSGTGGGVAVLETGGEPIVVRLAPTERSAPGLAPAVRRALRAASWKPADVQVVGVTIGPGSFTGLRIGVTTAKTLAYALGADLVAVHTLDVVARQTPVEADALWAVLDAHRGQLFAARYERDASNAWRRIGDTQLPTVEAWRAALRPGDLVSGPALATPATRLPDGVRLAPPSAWSPDAAAVALLTAELHAAGRRDDLWTLVPQYGRLAAAEEKRLRESGSP